MSEGIDIRRATPSDAAGIAHAFRITRQHNLPYLPDLHAPAEDLRYIEGTVLVDDTVFVADRSGEIVGFCAFKEGWVDHLYVHPNFQRRGLGAALLARAKSASTDLRLWVFQRNTGAIEFYEMNGFTLVQTSDGQHNEEREPDALYRWRKDQASLGRNRRRHPA